jgi:hypothetical protein
MVSTKPRQLEEQAKRFTSVHRSLQPLVQKHAYYECIRIPSVTDTYETNCYEGNYNTIDHRLHFFISKYATAKAGRQDS